jgi:hypothetical protein
MQNIINHFYTLVDFKIYFFEGDFTFVKIHIFNALNLLSNCDEKFLSVDVNRRKRSVETASVSVISNTRSDIYQVPPGKFCTLKFREGQGLRDGRRHRALTFQAAGRRSSDTSAVGVTVS